MPTRYLPPVRRSPKTSSDKPQPPPTGGSSISIFGTLEDFVATGTTIIKDDLRSSYVNKIPSKIPSNVSSIWFLELLTKLPWERPINENSGFPLNRQTVWMSKCTCPYGYGGVSMKPVPFNSTVSDITHYVFEQVLQLPLPDAVNINLYDGGLQMVGWHSDNEPIFDCNDV